MLYAASPTGLMRSFDCGQNWSRAPGDLGYANIVSLDAEVADERVILYVGTTGGTVENQASLMEEQPLRMITAGVYRYTTRSYWQYLPVAITDK